MSDVGPIGPSLSPDQCGLIGLILYRSVGPSLSPDQCGLIGQILYQSVGPSLSPGSVYGLDRSVWSSSVLDSTSLVLSRHEQAQNHLFTSKVPKTCKRLKAQPKTHKRRTMTRQITQNEWTKNIKNTTYQLPQT